ncbi:winged helix-turn-helix domain-containing protein [Paenibacillus filicis]|uniref:Winged helix-turn-helix domain-containing protein n=1 Tax=Paenibacillus gyeongsangnamensis TaxID=3388067 RepID=A0ABT4QJX6_9BACL|nr:winged helix-turn-helix domain-containing protein [Paenibacillus filicis]MCZ8517183.1 winged helix-turn-helix domain-containing protein [Paenibacillus filicis]
MLAEPSRSAMLTLLLDGGRHPAGELAASAGITPQTASFHLNKMTETGIVLVEKHGRHRYYHIGRREDAEIIEQLSALAGPVEIKSLRQSEQMKRLRHARFCYDHLAGEVAVTIAEALVDRQILTKQGLDYELTVTGESFFQSLGIDIPDLRKKRRAFARCCLDWTERRHHLAGALGKAMTDQLFARGWLKRRDNGRGVDVTPEGLTGLSAAFGIDFG